MDNTYIESVWWALKTLFDKGLIYKGLRIVNWDPASATALADDEVEHKEIQGHLYHIRYKFADSDDYIVVATTRPETLLGDTAVAIAPDDEEKKHLLGKKVIIPFVNRAVEIIADEHVDKEFGTGFVKVTPAHDPNDFEIGQRHNLPMVLVLDKDGKVLPVCKEFKDGEYTDELPIPDYLAGKDRFEARKIIIEKLKESGQLEKIEPHLHAVGHSYRSKVPIEPYLSVQWFVKMKPLAKEALRVVQDGRIHPARIEEVVEKVRSEIVEQAAEEGAQALYSLGVHGMNKELVRLIGRLRFHNIMGQNLLKHKPAMMITIVFIRGPLSENLIDFF